MNSTRWQVWRPSLPRTADSTPLLGWLRDRGSLTARIQSRGRFAVRVLRQGLGIPTADEARLLGLDPGVHAWVREVALSCNEQIVVFAHTVLPRRPRGPLTVWLSRLGERSLGALLFAHAGFTRGPMAFHRLDRRHALFTAAWAALQLRSRVRRLSGHAARASTLPASRCWSARSVLVPAKGDQV